MVGRRGRLAGLSAIAAAMLATAPAVALNEVEQTALAWEFADAMNRENAALCDVIETLVLRCFVRTDDANLEPFAEEVVRSKPLKALGHHGWLFAVISIKTGTLLERPFRLDGGTRARLYTGFCREREWRGDCRAGQDL